MSDISDIALFASLSDESKRRFAPAVQWRNYPENETVIDLDDPSTDVIFVISGSVRVIHRAENGKQVILGEHGPGAVLGELAAIDGIERSASITTLQKSRIATMRDAAFMDLLASEPDVCRTILKTLAGRVRLLTRQLSEQAYLTTGERLCAELLRMSKPRKGHEGQRSISPPPTHQDLAERVAARREVVSRALSGLEKEGLLEKTRGALVLADPGELNRRVTLKGMGVELGEG